ncbi:hypothetical protein CAPTEDRAFT_78515, partial [Capitella teleta]
RADTPGHCAKYGTYSFMELNLNRILDVQVVPSIIFSEPIQYMFDYICLQSNEVRGSYHMEKEGLIRCLDTVMGHDLQIGTIVTDRHRQIAKFIREELQGVIHRFDVWHVVKGFSKKWESTSKLKGCQDLSLWTKSVVNHMYWSAASS